METTTGNDMSEVINFGKIDLGSGKFRKPGFIGIDNLEASEYQGMTEEDKKWIIQWDLNKCIPFPDNSIDEVLISHFLEHVQSPKFLLWEVLRVCKHGAHVEVYAPLHEMESIGHITEFSEYWFEDVFATEFPGKFSITHKHILKDKKVDLRTTKGVTTRSFNELNIIFKVVK